MNTVISGHAGLVSEIIDEIQTVGAIPFSRFMELALYHPQFGYYMRMDAEPESSAIGEERIGWEGDYYTSCDVHPILAQSLAKQIRQVDHLLGHPDPFTIIEMGAGKGLLARDLIRDCAAHSESFSRMNYVLIERSPSMRAAQRNHLASWLGPAGRVSWVDRLEDLSAESVVGVLLSNELVDAFPVHRITIEQGRIREIFVDYDGDRLCEQLRDASNPELLQYVDRVGLSRQTPPDGFIADINLHALGWMEEVARVLGKESSSPLITAICSGPYGIERSRHVAVTTNKWRPKSLCGAGQQDMTAHVDFTSLAAIGEEHGLRLTGFTNI